MPLGSSSAAPVMSPGPSCFSSGRRAGLPAGCRVSSLIIACRSRGAPRYARRCAIVAAESCENLKVPDFFQRRSGEPIVVRLRARQYAVERRTAEAVHPRKEIGEHRAVVVQHLVIAVLEEVRLAH